MANEYIGRRESVGVGIEGTQGTSVAPQAWVKHLSLDLQRQVTKVDNTSAVGRVEDVNESIVTAVWAEGSVEGKVGSSTIGYFLHNIFGSVATTDNADSDASVKDHTFDTLQSNTPPALTFVKKTPLTNRRHAYGVLDSLEITWGDEYVMFTAAVKAREGATGTDTVSYVSESEFIRKHITAKVAANVAGLGAANALSTKSGRITITRPGTPFFGSGSNSFSDITTGAWAADGEIVLRYNSTDLEDDWYDNTALAFQLGIVNSDVTIGSAANPGLVFTAPQTTFRSFATSNDLDEIIEQTVGFKCELSLSDAYALRAVLTNTTASYAAA